MMITIDHLIEVWQYTFHLKITIIYLFCPIIKGQVHYNFASESDFFHTTEQLQSHL